MLPGRACCGLAILAAAALGNAWSAPITAGVEWHFWQGPTDLHRRNRKPRQRPATCSSASTPWKGDPLDEVQWRFLRLVAGRYNVLISLLDAAIAAVGQSSPVRR